MNYEGNGMTPIIAFLVFLLVKICMLPLHVRITFCFLGGCVMWACVLELSFFFFVLFLFCCLRGVGSEGMHTWCEGNR